MSDSKRLLAELRRKVEEAKRKLEEQESALLVVEEMLGVSPPSLAEVPATVKADAQVKQNKAATSRSAPASTGTIIDNITSILPDFNENTYTASDVYVHMLDAGTAPKNKGAISTSLRKLAIRKKIEVAVQGKGKAPSVYKNIGEVSFM